MEKTSDLKRTISCDETDVAAMLEIVSGLDYSLSPVAFQAEMRRKQSALGALKRHDTVDTPDDMSGHVVDDCAAADSVEYTFESSLLTTVDMAKEKIKETTMLLNDIQKMQDPLFCDESRLILKRGGFAVIDHPDFSSDLFTSLLVKGDCEVKLWEQVVFLLEKKAVVYFNHLKLLVALKQEPVSDAKRQRRKPPTAATTVAANVAATVGE